MLQLHTGVLPLLLFPTLFEPNSGCNHYERRNKYQNRRTE